ncbi:Sortilin, neurotensin receptor 3 [Muriicola jejuensis]|uniref:Glycosyl hydrolase n=1 Tax=Muriicola jejuensis TaxID=504488 RepID=A0A6P0UEV6_9FLAO|nr:glycosyl hydrolase [Muriicola jejuensis]NER09793.1 glycosyl hydrolase [Muriicola jejuensis]SMP05697.1 Sortilin, neurotensin receptor 3 [Muriicola jejuensis]
MRSIHLFLFLFAVSTALVGQTAESYFQPLKYRNIGPYRGGRSVTATGVVGDPLTYYMGTTGGGLWKTTDAGVSWENISDGYFEMGSVGAVAVSPSNPNVVYCGMGEHAVRGVMTSYGDGVYKSTDAGRTWKKIGLEKTQHIARILIHPTNPDIVYVAAQGALYGPTKDRGIYKSTDGGITWKQVLYVNDLTGCNELSMVWSTPEVIYASMWHHQRTPDKVISGGEGSGLYKSTDGGETWKKIHNGLPEEKGKMAIAVSQANPQKVYALVESDSNKDLGGLFVSEDAGASWKMVSGDNRLVQRAWYYIEVFPDPNNEHVVYVMSAQALRSIDGGKTWEEIEGKHGDYHDLWINPSDSRNMIIADDGGAAISFDYGKNWSSLDIMPTAQFYRVNADRLFPYNLYGGQQDNTSVRIAHLSLSGGGIGERDWSYSAGGESAFLAFDPDDPRYVMGGSYLGYIDLLDVKTKATTKIVAAPIQYLGRAARDMKYLFNWNAPIIRSQHEPNTFFHCAQLVLRTRDMGVTWEEISPDLTRNMDEKQGKGGGPYTVEAVGAENYGTIAYMTESPHESGVYWTGSDDGLVYLTRDGGENWQNVTPKGLKECLINAIEVSPHDAGTAYIATTRYKFNDHTPALYKTEDYGKTWTNISSGIPYGSFTRVVREDTSRKGLLYAGTEKGIYISWNDGQAWQPFQLNLPNAPITDLLVHQGDLLVATSGRSFWILDDLAALAQYEPGKQGLKIYRPEDTLNASWGSPLSGDAKDFKGTHPTQGVNPANGMVLYYELPEMNENTPLTMEIRNEAGKLIRTFTSVKDSTYQEHNGGGPPPKPVLSTDKGLNRFVWDLNHPIMEGIPGAYMEAGFTGHKASPGTYEIRLSTGDQTAITKGNILPTPGFGVTEAEYGEYDDFMTAMETELNAMHKTVNRLFKVQAQLRSLLEGLEEGPLKASGRKLLAELVAWDEDMIQRKSQAYDDVENFPNKFTAEYIYLINLTNSEIPRINQGSRDRKRELDAQWAGLRSRAQRIIETSIPAYNKELWQSGIGAIQVY